MVRRAAAMAGFLALVHAGSAAAQGSLRGTVTAAGTGGAITGAQVRLAGTGAFTGPGGAYEVGGVPEGIHEVVVTLIGYEAERRQVIIVDGQPTTLNVVLTRTTLALGNLVAVGSRRAQARTVTESPVPVDVMPPAEILRQGDTDLADLIRNVVPSFNVNIQPISDAATFVRPANLRALAPDHTLVLVNGKRRHRT
ncbi:MAG: carboxypeptidase regulatory-like domain-containing protein, partial [Gemmatimonadota bacterium]|nr:carboxypeptidase regulatory-like domain-containing protein [Gemmatimonadota bacterium]MDE2984089.1 carboxypeptidase regulatory-like domain-containing protein [Gemmatimonadota bacterium]